MKRSLLGLLVVFAGCGSPEPPELVLWAWERPEDLSFLAPGEARVAILVNRIVIEGEQVRPFPRTTPVYGDFEAVTPVVRVETNAPTLDHQQLDQLVREISLVTRDSRFRGLQIDFDARESERPFYRLLLERLAQRYEPLSMTALVSWCGSESWLQGLPVDEIVPMVFRMGRGGGPWVELLRNEGEFPFDGCNHSFGFSTDEPYPLPVEPSRVYLFHPTPWTEDAFRQQLARWR